MSKDIIDLNESTIKDYVESIRPEDLEIRKKIDFGYFFKANIIEIFEIRPRWDQPDIIENFPFVRIRFYKSKQLWSLYWKRASGKWELYEPFQNSTHLTEIIDVIKKDNHGCFFG